MKHTKPPRNKVIAAFTRFLTSRELRYDLDLARGVLHAGFEGTNAKWRYLAYEDDSGRRRNERNPGVKNFDSPSDLERERLS